jgi:hypothetical protein
VHPVALEIVVPIELDNPALLVLGFAQFRSLE